MDKTVETEWKPNEELLRMLMEMGIAKIAAEHALFYTGNNSAEAAASYVFDNFENDEASTPPLTSLLKTQLTPYFSILVSCIFCFTFSCCNPNSTPYFSKHVFLLC